MARYLRDLGYDCKLLCWQNEADHFQPHADSFRNDWKDLCIYFDWTNKPAMDADPEQIRKDLSEYDILIGCYAAPRYVERAGLKLDFFIPHGGDFLTMPFYEYYLPKSRKGLLAFHLKRLLGINKQVKECDLQLKGIRNSRYFLIDYFDQYNEFMIHERIRYPGERISSTFPHIYIRDYTFDTIEQFAGQSRWNETLLKLRAENDLIIYQQSQHIWKNMRMMNDYKGNDILIRGFAKFTKSNPGLRSKLLFHEYGIDVQASKDLIKSLGIEDRIIWLPKIYRKDIMVVLHHADIGVAPFNHVLSNGSIYEILVAGKPLLHDGIKEDSIDYKVISQMYPELYPIVKAETPDEVASVLADYMHNKEAYISEGKKGTDWVMRHVVDGPLKLIVEKINAL